MNIPKLHRHTAARAAVCLLSLWLLLTACAPGEERSLLWYQSEMTAASLTENGRTWRVIFAPGGFTAVLTAPESVAGVTFAVTESAAYASVGDLSIPVGETMLTGARRAAACLSLSDGMLTGIDANPAAGDDWAVLAHYRTPDAEYDVALGADGLPIRIDERRDGETCRWTVTVELAS